MVLSGSLAMCIWVVNPCSMINGNVTPSVATTGSLVRFISWNVKGIGNQVKAFKVFNHLKRLYSDVVFFTGDTLYIPEYGLP